MDLAGHFECFDEKVIVKADVAALPVFSSDIEAVLSGVES
jgi:hypothetical protein